jgi:DNA-binding NarL/FixJ family response regulator
MTARLVIADDDADFRLLLRLALGSDSRFSLVGEAGDADELVAVAGAAHAHVALVECDMAGADAFDALPLLRAAAPGCRVVLVSGYGDDDVRFASRVSGAVGYLRKDTPASRLADELSAVAALVGLVQDVLEESSTHLDPDLRSAGQARRFVTEALGNWGLDEVSEIVALLVSELVTNAIVHARSDVDVAVHLTADAARVEVSDRSPQVPVVRTADDQDESGRGLAIVQSLARAWGVRPRADGGKTIWFEVERPGVSAAP